MVEWVSATSVVELNHWVWSWTYCSYTRHSFHGMRNINPPHILDWLNDVYKLGLSSNEWKISTFHSTYNLSTQDLYIWVVFPSMGNHNPSLNLLSIYTRFINLGCLTINQKSKPFTKLTIYLHKLYTFGLSSQNGKSKPFAQLAFYLVYKLALSFSEYGTLNPSLNLQSIFTRFINLDCLPVNGNSQPFTQLTIYLHKVYKFVLSSHKSEI